MWHGAAFHAHTALPLLTDWLTYWRHTSRPDHLHPQVSPSCVAVRFDSFTVRAGALPEAALSLTWLRPLGYVDTLYLDGELRVSVGDKGGLFILSRAGESELAERQGVAKRA